LLKTAELTDALKNEVTLNPDFKQNWEKVLLWSEEARYEYAATRAEAVELVQAIDDPANGVLQWLQRYW
jgi:hypothetical protein